MQTEQRASRLPGILALAAALLSPLLLFLVPLHLSEPKTVWMENKTEAWTWDGTQDFQETATFVLNVTIPGDPKDFALLPSLLEAESYSFPRPPENSRELDRRSLTWINLSFNGVPVAHGRNSRGGGGGYEDHCGVPCSLEEIRYNRALREGHNEIRFDVSYVYDANSTLAVNATARVGPIRVTLFEMDIDGDAVSDRYQLVPGLPAVLLALLVTPIAGGLAYVGGRKLAWAWKPKP